MTFLYIACPHADARHSMIFPKPVKFKKEGADLIMFLPSNDSDSVEEYSIQFAENTTDTTGRSYLISHNDGNTDYFLSLKKMSGGNTWKRLHIAEVTWEWIELPNNGFQQIDNTNKILTSDLVIAKYYKYEPVKIFNPFETSTTITFDNNFELPFYSSEVNNQMFPTSITNSDLDMKLILENNKLLLQDASGDTELFDLTPDVVKDTTKQYGLKCKIAAVEIIDTETNIRVDSNLGLKHNSRYNPNYCMDIILFGYTVSLEDEIKKCHVRTENGNDRETEIKNPFATMLELTSTNEGSFENTTPNGSGLELMPTS